ncbi:MAG: TonB-dependent receptor [Saprospiraceae bacterium]|nr:TonB-dependent receptor [Saprospiraceae bacterium]
MKRLYILIIVLFCLPYLHGQDTIALPSDQVEVVKNYEAIILQARKKTFSVDPTQRDYDPIVFNYAKKNPKVIEFERPAPIIQALSYRAEDDRPEDVKDGTVYGSYGTLNTLNAGAAFHYYIEDWIEAGFQVDHFSAKDNDIAFQKMGKTEASVYGGYYLNPRTKVKLNLHGGFDRFNTGALAIPDSIFSTQEINEYGANLNFSHTSFENLGLVVRSQLDFNRIDVRHDSLNESLLGARISILKSINDKINLEIPTHLTQLMGAFDENYFDLKLTPKVRFKADKYFGYVGALFVTGTEISAFRPLVHLTLPKLFEEVNVHVFAKAEYSRNGFHSLISDNPYLIPSSAFFYSPEIISKYGFSLDRDINRLNVFLSTSYVRLDSTVNYQFSAVAARRFVTQVVDRSEINIKAKLSYRLSSSFVARTFLKRRIFIEDDIVVTYVPEWTVGGALDYKSLNKKLDLSLSLKYLSSRNYSIFPSGIGEPAPSPMDGFMDVSASATYRINPSVEVFARGTNLLAPDGAQIWFGHPIFERQIWGGLRVNI